MWRVEKLLLPLKGLRDLSLPGQFSTWTVAFPHSGTMSGVVMVQPYVSNCFSSFQDLFPDITVQPQLLQNLRRQPSKQVFKINY